MSTQKDTPPPVGPRRGHKAIKQGDAGASGRSIARADASVEPTPDADEIRRALALLIERGAVFEIRVPKVGGRKTNTASGFFDDIEAAVTAAVRLARNRKTPAVYITLNSVDPDLLARRANRIEEYAEGLTTADDIRRRMRLLVDFDPPCKSGISSTDSEHQVLLDRARRCRDWLAARGWPAPLYGDSGNGAHLIYAVDLPNDAEAAALVERVLQALAAVFGDDEVIVDSRVRDASRVSKLYGTPTRKGDHTPARPHRLSRIIDAPDRLEPVAADLLEALASEAPAPVTPTPKDRPAKPAGRSTGGDFFRAVNDAALADLARWVPALFGDKARVYKDGYRVRSADLGRDLEEDLSLMPAGIHDFGAERGLTAIDTVMEFGDPATPLEAARWLAGLLGLEIEDRQAARSVASHGQVADLDAERAARKSKAGKADKPRPEPDLMQRRTDAANARRFAEQHGDDVRWVWEFGRWFIFDGHRWRRDDDGEIYRRAIETGQSIFREAAEAGNANTTAALAEWGRDTLQMKRIRPMLELARAELGLTISQRRLDALPMLLGVQNGVVDLATGEFRAGRRDDYLTKSTAVDYDPRATCSRWVRFVSEIMGGKQALVDYLQRWVGYVLTGKTNEQCFNLLHGVGANGKSTLLDVLAALLGTDYATPTAPDQLLARRNDRHPTELADLRGARLVVSVETGEGRRLNENLVKQITGGDRIKARFMRQDFFEFEPTFKLMLATNHRPTVKGTDHAIWRRIHLVPFVVIFDGEQRDDQLDEKLLAELPGILNWAIDGCLAWQREGLRPPPEVLEATDDYRRQMDVLADFIGDSCQRTEQATVPKGVLYDAYRAWCADNGERELTQRELRERLLERGFHEVRLGKKGTRGWKGIRLNDEWRERVRRTSGELVADFTDDDSRARAQEADTADTADTDFGIPADKEAHIASIQKNASAVSAASAKTDDTRRRGKL